MNIGHYLAAAARSYPERPAVSIGEKLCWSYGEFFDRVARIATALRAIPGVAAGDRIALAMKNCPQYLEVRQAIWHAGLCAVPMNAKLHPREFAYILGDSGARICFVSADLSEPFGALMLEGSLDRVISVEDPEYEKLSGEMPLPLQLVEPNAPAWLLYTSGTTGRPKGATMTHHSFAALTTAFLVDLCSVDPYHCIIHAGPLSHATGVHSMGHVAKAANHIIPESGGFNPAEIIDLLRRYDKVTLFCAPTMLNRLFDHPRSAEIRIDAIDTLFYGGAPMYVEDLKRFVARLGPRLVQGYGQSELATLTYLPKHMHVNDGHPDFEARLATVGIPRTGVQLRVVDEGGQDVPLGEVGEVIVRGDACMSGYWRNPEATAATIRDGWLFTGDLGALDDGGFLTLKDRSKDLIISGGMNIYPREVEEALLLHSGVAEVSVIGRQSAAWGEEVIAFVVRRAGCVVTPDELDRVCLDNIARFKRPKAYLFIDGLPKSNYGKVLKTELRELLGTTEAVAAKDRNVALAAKELSI